MRQLSKQAYAKDLNLTPDGEAVVFSHQAADRAPEVNLLTLANGKRRPLTRLNAWLRKKRGLLARRAPLVLGRRRREGPRGADQAAGIS